MMSSTSNFKFPPFLNKKMILVIFPSILLEFHILFNNEETNIYKISDIVKVSECIEACLFVVYKTI